MIKKKQNPFLYPLSTWSLLLDLTLPVSKYILCSQLCLFKLIKNFKKEAVWSIFMRNKHNYTVLVCTVGLWTIWVLGASTSLSSWKFMYNCRTSPLGPRFHIHRFSQFQLCNTMLVVQLHSRFQLFATPWTVAFQGSLSFTIFWNLLKVITIESVMLSKHLILCCPLLLPSSWNLSQHQGLLKWVSSLHQVVKVLEIQLQH